MVLIAVNKELLNEIQDWLDYGLNFTQISEKVGVHRTTVMRLTRKYSLDDYIQFDEWISKPQSSVNFEWLWEEDRLEEMLYTVFDEGCFVIEKPVTDDDYAVSTYLISKYKGLNEYLKAKKCRHLYDFIFKECYQCGGVFHVDDYAERIHLYYGLSNNCKKCRREQKSSYLKSNPEIYKRATLKYMTLKKYMPFVNDFNVEEYKECCLTGAIDDVHLDHFIALSTGHGGTYKANLIPLEIAMNISKNNKNPFEWCYKKSEIDLENFWYAVLYLSKLNCLTFSEYKRFVYWCYDNKRGLYECLSDRRHSIEIWREQARVQFPLPSYVYDSS